MKALSIKQPWANMIAGGKKVIETRKWSTKYRGPLLIVASLKPDLTALPETTDPKLNAKVVKEHGPYGCAIATAYLAGCRRMMREDEYPARCKLYRGAFAWDLVNIQRIKPFPVKGRLGLYEVEMNGR